MPQLKDIAASLVTILFMGVVGAMAVALALALALALGLAFGLGGRETAGQLWRQWYRTPAPVVAGGGGPAGGGNGGDRAPAREERRETDGWRTSAVSKLREARDAMARGEADPALATELDAIIARVTHRSRPESSYQASI
jgi:hypothetical protein